MMAIKNDPMTVSISFPLLAFQIDVLEIYDLINEEYLFEQYLFYLSHNTTSHPELFHKVSF